MNNAKNMMDNVNNEYSKLSGKIDQVDLLKAPAGGEKEKIKLENDSESPSLPDNL